MAECHSTGSTARIEARFRETLDAPWTHLTPLRLGEPPTGLGTPDSFVTVEEDGTPRLRVDLYAGGETFAFQEARVWHRWVVIGSGHRVYLVSQSGEPAVTVELGGYFAGLYPDESCLLVASAARLFRLSEEGEILWVSEELGIDGVVVERVEAGLISGQGEWDPPGGWRPFRVCLQTGSASEANGCGPS
ncbi:MAG: hypothetical protein ACK47B_02400 [Armatimonadota bacterium]